MEIDRPKKDVVKDIRTKILSGFRLYVLEHGQSPPSVYKFTKILKIDEVEFYKYFTSFRALQSAVWVELFDRTLENLYAQEVYSDYSAREKLLAFFFTWIEELKKDRSFLLVLYDRFDSLSKFPPSEFGQFRTRFKEFAKLILMEGKESEEIVKRPFINQQYDEGLWLQVWFILRFWLKDSSPSFEKTDVAIEKSVHLAFDLMGKNSLDSMVDFAKFLFQNK